MSLDIFKYFVMKGLFYVWEKSKLIEDFILFEYIYYVDFDDKVVY